MLSGCGGTVLLVVRALLVLEQFVEAGALVGGQNLAKFFLGALKFFPERG